MELQWPLILFTTFLAWACGLYAVQNIAALRGGSKAPQMPALIASFVLLVIGGIAVFFHLQHWERIFNGFGHITSGITQELIAIVVMVIVMVVQVACLRRQEGKIPAWVNWAAIIVSVALIVVAGHSYMMVSRPAWNSAFEVLGLVGGAAALGAGSFAVIESLSGADDEDSLFETAPVMNAGTWANLACVVLYVVACGVAGSSFVDMGYTWDPTTPMATLPDAAQYSPFASANVGATVVAIAAAAGGVAFGLVGKKLGWKAAGAGVTACALVSVVALRMLFYLVGGAAYLIY